MKKSTKLFTLICVILVAAMCLSACGTTPTATPSTEPTVVPTETPVEPTATPTETPVEPTATPTETPVEPTATPTESPVEPTATPTPTATPKPMPTKAPNYGRFDDITGKVDANSVYQYPLEDKVVAEPFDGDVSKSIYWTALWGENWKDMAAFRFETTEPVVITAYEFFSLNAGGLLKAEDPGNSWILYGIDADGNEIELSIEEGWEATAGSIMCYVENPQAFSKYKLALLNTSKISGKDGGIDNADEWSLGELKLYTDKTTISSDAYQNITDKVTTGEGVDAAFDGNVETKIELGADKTLHFKTNAGVWITAYEIFGLNESAAMKADGTLNAWRLYGVTAAGTLVELDYKAEQASTTGNGSRVFYIVNPNAHAFNEFKLVFESTAAGDDKYSIADIKLYSDYTKTAIDSKKLDVTDKVSQDNKDAFDDNSNTKFYVVGGDVAELEFTTSDYIFLTAYEFIGLNEGTLAGYIKEGSLNSWKLYGIDNAGNAVLLDSRENVFSTINNNNLIFAIDDTPNDHMKYKKFKVQFTSTQMLNADNLNEWSLNDMKLYTNANTIASVAAKYVDVTELVESCTNVQTGAADMSLFDGDASTLMRWVGGDIAEFEFTTKEAIILTGYVFVSANEGTENSVTAPGLRNSWKVFGIDEEGNEVQISNKAHLYCTMNNGTRFNSIAMNDTTNRAFSKFKVQFSETSRVTFDGQNEWTLGDFHIYVTQ